jgi:hypothetical protein
MMEKGEHKLNLARSSANGENILCLFPLRRLVNNIKNKYNNNKNGKY